MNMKIGFIGSGNMATAMIGGMINSKVVQASQVIISDLDVNKLEALKSIYGIVTIQENVEVARQADMLFLAVKPHQYPEVIAEIKSVVTQNTVIISIAAGQSMTNIEAAFGYPIKLVRSMPNTPALVQEAMSALVRNPQITDYEFEQVQMLFNSFGKCEVITEDLMDSFIAVSGSSPAYVYLFIEAMADAAVLQGMQRDKAYRFASQAVLGAAKMVLETGTHPGVLKDAVCSPGGTTIAAVVELEKSGMRASIMKAMEVCQNKSHQLTGKEN